MLSNLSLVMKFLGNVFTNFIFENLRQLREELELPVAIKRSFLSSYMKKIFRVIWAASTPSEANSLPKLFHDLNQYLKALLVS